jgi:hypothetical protein
MVQKQPARLVGIQESANYRQGPGKPQPLNEKEP